MLLTDMSVGVSQAMPREELEARVRQLEAQLQQSELRNRELLRALEHLPCGVEIYDHKGWARYLNPAMVELTALPSAEVAIGRFNILTDRFSIETGLKVFYERAYAGEVVRTEEFVIEMERASDKWGTGPREIWFKLVLVPTFDHHGEVASVVAIVFETTESRRLEKALELVSRREGIELLAGGVAHDFNNLLTAIVMNGELVRELSEDDAVVGLSEDILLASQQAIFLTRQLFDFTRQRAAHVETVDLADLTQAIARAFRNSLLQVGQLELHLQNRQHLADVDAGQYKQVFMNMLTNAMEALPEHGGMVTVSLTEAHLDGPALEEFVFASTPAPGRWNVLEVADNGCGMSPDTIKRVFEPFFTTKSSGAGLGLTSTLGIIQSHGGGVSVRSSVGQGTSFRICIPLSQRNLSLPPTQAPGQTLPPSARILLVDNSPHLRGSLRVLLERLELVVADAADGQQALQLIKAADPPFDLVLMDIMMPGLNGTDVLRMLRADGSSLLVLMMSTHSEVGELAVKDDPMSAFIQKPFATSELLHSIGQLLGEGS